ncbi:MAG: serine protease [Myxococcaceae bacterium]
MRSALLAVAVLAVTGCATQKAVAPKMVAAPAVAEATPSRRDTAKKILPSSVRVFIDDQGQPLRNGAGVVIANAVTASGTSSFILTNAHVLDTRGMKEPKLRIVTDVGADSFEYEGELTAVGTIPDMDLALIRIPGVLLAPVELASDTDLETGDDVLVVSAPFGRSLTLSGGMISNVEWDSKLKAPSMLKTDAAVGYGTSGGGVFSVRSGKLLGLVEGYRTTKVGFAIQDQPYAFDLPIPGETFAAPAAKVRRFLADRGLSALVEKSDRRAAMR